MAKEAEENHSAYFLEQSRKMNIFITAIVIIAGLIGNFLTLFVFLQKKFRTNPSSVYLLSLAIFDSMFLITHFFEGIFYNY
jgi:hypothetical protein